MSGWGSTGGGTAASVVMATAAAATAQPAGAVTAAAVALPAWQSRPEAYLLPRESALAAPSLRAGGTGAAGRMRGW